MSKGKVDIRMGGRYRDLDESVSGTPVGNDGLKEYITEVINNTPINWTQITGDPMTNNEFKTFIDNLTDIINLNIANSGDIITQEFLDYITALGDQLDILNQWITANGDITNEFKTYVDGRITELKQYFIDNIILGDIYTTEIKKYIDDRITDIQNIVNELGDIINNDLGDIVTNIVNNITGGRETRLISGAVTWMQNLTFSISDLVYLILGRQYTSLETTITIPANVSASPVFAIIWADIYGNIGWTFGVPAPNPLIPEVLNPAAMIRVSTVYIPGLGTAPAPDPNGETGAVVNTVIYDENIEWATAKVEETGAVITLDDTTAPAQGTKNIKIALTGAAATGQKLKLETSSKTIHVSTNVAGTGAFLENPFAISFKNFLPDMNTDYIDAAGLRHLIWYKIKPGDVVSTAVSRATLIKTPLKCTSIITEDLIAADLNFTQPGDVLGMLEAAAPLVNDGYYDLYLNISFTRYDQQFKPGTAALFNPLAAAVSFTAPAAVNAKDGTINLSLQSSAPWLINSGLLLDIYNGTAKTGSLSILPGSLYGYNSANPYYQRLTIPVADFHPTQNEITKLVIRPVNSFPTLNLFIDNIVLQTGVKTEPLVIDKYVESADLNANALLTIHQTGGESNKTVQFSKVAKTGSYNDLTDKPIIPVKDWQPILFEDVVKGVSKSYVIDLKAPVAYKILSAVFQTDNGTLTGVQVKINSVAVSGLDNITVTTSIVETAATSGFNVAIGDKVEISDSAGYTETPTLIRGSIIIQYL